jgi:hypothetical protein
MTISLTDPFPVLPLAWIAERLSMGSRGYLAWLLGRRKPGKARKRE